jgi:hypothetical protein
MQYSTTHPPSAHERRRWLIIAFPTKTSANQKKQNPNGAVAVSTGQLSVGKFVFPQWMAAGE